MTTGVLGNWTGFGSQAGALGYSSVGTFCMDHNAFENLDNPVQAGSRSTWISSCDVERPQQTDKLCTETAEVYEYMSLLPV